MELVPALLDLPERELLERREVRTAGVVVVTSDRGLAGGYNTNVIRMAERHILEQRDQSSPYSSTGVEGAAVRFPKAGRVLVVHEHARREPPAGIQFVDAWRHLLRPLAEGVDVSSALRSVTRKK